MAECRRRRSRCRCTQRRRRRLRFEAAASAGRDGADPLASRALRGDRRQQERGRNGSRWRSPDPSDGIWDWIIKTDQLYFSPRCLELLGRNSDRLARGHGQLGRAAAPRRCGRVPARPRNHLEGISLAFQMECRIQHTNMTYRWFLVRHLAPERIRQGLAGRRLDQRYQRAQADRCDDGSAQPHRALRPHQPIDHQDQAPGTRRRYRTRGEFRHHPAADRPL